jgi:integrase
MDTYKDQVAANIMRLALCTGLRKSEIFRLQWDDIDFERGFIIIRDPKGGQDQKIPLNETTREIFNTMHQDSESVCLFPGRSKREHITDCKGCSSIAKEAELPKGFRPVHGLRHVYASALASSGKVDLYTLQKLLTHKSPVMTQRYAHLRDEALKRASGVVDDLIKAVSNKIEEKDRQLKREQS